MNWLYSKQIFNSEKNGQILCTRSFGRYQLTVGGLNQSGPYINALWKKALTKIPKDIRIKKILVLGFGGGGINTLLHRRYRNIHVTAIEWDSMMVKITEKVIGFGNYPRPQFIIGDARDIVPTLTETYDLILFDLFKGDSIHQELAQQPFIGHLIRVLDRKGCLIINAFKQPEIINQLAQISSCHQRWRYLLNDMALFRHYGLGHPGDPLPPGYLYRYASSAFMERHYKNTVIQVVKNTAIGYRRDFGLLSFEGYKDDHMPTIEPYPKWRLISWMPFCSVTEAPGWHRDWTNVGICQTGVAILKPDYFKHWNTHAQRQLKKWHKQQEFHVTEGTVEDMKRGFFHHENKSYHKSLAKQSLTTLQQYINNHQNLVHLWVIKHKKTHAAVAGLAVLDIPETKTSVHAFAFTLDRDLQGGGTALVDRWYQESLKNNIQFMDFDSIATPHDPRSWNGFSRFKKQFNPYLICRPRSWIRLVPPQKKATD